MFSTRKAAPPAFDNVNQANSFEEDNSVPVMQRSDLPAMPLPAVARSVNDADIVAQTEMARQYAGEVAGARVNSSDIPEESEARLVIGRAIKMKGSVEDCGVLQVDGNFEAAAQSKYLKVSETGVFVGDADVHSAEIIGRFDGSIVVKDKLVISSTGVVTGTVRYGSIEIAAGGKISGDIQAILKNELPAEQPAEVVKQEPVSQQPVNQEPVNQEAVAPDAPQAQAQAQPAGERKTLKLNLADGQPELSDTVVPPDTAASG
jgi:cytoskeletal protein CcmA (bactofilin family)